MRVFFLVIFFVFQLPSFGQIIDTTFNVGVVPTDISYIFDAEFQEDGKIIIGGSISSYNGTETNTIIRLNSDLTLDQSFNTTTLPGGNSNEILINNKKVLVDKDGRYFLLDENGAVDETFNYASHGNTINLQLMGEKGYFVYNLGFSRDRCQVMDLQGNIVRSYPDYNTDFCNGSGWTRRNTLIIQGDSMAVSKGVRYRLGNALSIDPTFTPLSFTEEEQFGYPKMGTDNNSNLYFAAKLGGIVNDSFYGGVIKTNQDGILDTSFRFPEYFYNTIHDYRHITAMNDGRVILTYQLDSGDSIQYIQRFLANGAVDPTFDMITVTGTFNNYFRSFAAYTKEYNGEVIIYGYLKTINNQPAAIGLVHENNTIQIENDIPIRNTNPRVSNTLEESMFAMSEKGIYEIDFTGNSMVQIFMNPEVNEIVNSTSFNRLLRIGDYYILNRNAMDKYDPLVINSQGVIDSSGVEKLSFINYYSTSPDILTFHDGTVLIGEFGEEEKYGLVKLDDNLNIIAEFYPTALESFSRHQLEKIGNDFTLLLFFDESDQTLYGNLLDNNLEPIGKDIVISGLHRNFYGIIDHEKLIITNENRIIMVYSLPDMTEDNSYSSLLPKNIESGIKLEDFYLLKDTNGDVFKLEIDKGVDPYFQATLPFDYYSTSQYISHNKYVISGFFSQILDIFKNFLVLDWKEPSSPELTIQNVSSSTIDLEWASVDGASKYYLERKIVTDTINKNNFEYELISELYENDFTEELAEFPINGFVYYRLASWNESGSNYSNEVSVDLNILLSIDNQEQKSLIISPNPSHNGDFFIHSKLMIKDLQIFSLSGKLMGSEKMLSKNYKIDMTRYGQGVYIMKFVFENNQVTQRKVIINY